MPEPATMSLTVLETITSPGSLGQSGGAGYLNGSPLARAYRDVRALRFMHPLGSSRFLGQLAAGREPSLH